MTNFTNWLQHLNWQIDFYQRAFIRSRTDSEFPWAVLDQNAATRTPIQTARHLAKKTLQFLGWDPAHSKKWLNEYAEPLWETRTLLHDDLSRTLYDATLIVRSVGHQKFFFPRIDFDNLADILGEQPFQSTDLPTNYLNLSLQQYDIRLNAPPAPSQLKIIAYAGFLELLNTFRQYLIQRGPTNLSPAPADTVLDCGACIGDMSLIFAGLVGPQGQVHLFDPVPLHTRYCQRQADLNPTLSHVFHINELAVGNQTITNIQPKQDSNKIAPGGLAIDTFSTTTLDDYVQSKQLSRVDFIKMDIEGFELDAISGAAHTIRTLKPRLAISAYHKPDDFWTIPLKLKSLNPTYTFYFGHHSPIGWESVIYAVQH
jgi:FkbM family methyltransferase